MRNRWLSLCRKSQSDGFTLVELIVALGIISILLIAVSSAMLFSMQGVQYARAQVTIANAANQKLEQIRALSFTDIGNVSGNPAGVIPLNETVTVDGRTYQMTTKINWVDTSNGVSPNWDYKEAEVTITGNGFYSNNKTLTKKLSTIYTRNSEQPPLTGAHIRFHVYRGWNYSDPSNLIPVENVRTKAGIYQVLSNQSGLATYLGLTPASHVLDVQPEMLNMMVLPGSFPQSVALANNTTTEVNAQVERPVSIHVSFKEALGLTPLVLPTSVTGNLMLDAPYGAGLTHSFTGTAADGSIIGLSNAWKSLWPVGTGYAGSYNLRVTPVTGYLTPEIYLWDNEENTHWQGTFSGPGTEKDVSILFIKLPEPPDGTNEYSDEGDFKWTNGSSGVIDHAPSHNGVAYKAGTDALGNPVWYVDAYRFNAKQSSIDWLKTNNDTNVFHASEFYFIDSLEAKKTLKLATNRCVFQNEIKLLNNGTILLDVLDTLSIKPDGKTVQIPQESLDLIKQGKDILPSLIGTVYANKSYGELYLQEDFTLDGFTLSSGMYYFPDGFDLKASYGKAPDKGGLIRK